MQGLTIDYALILFSGTVGDGRGALTVRTGQFMA